MASRFPVVAVLGSLTWVAACGDPNSEAPCPEAMGEFPSTHCAFVQGRLTAAGVPIAGAGLLVDDFVPPVGYAYISDAAATDALGRFSLLVFRVNHIQPEVLDTARVYVKRYASVAAARARGPADDSLSVLMRFAPMGTLVDTTEVELTVP
jgi:hypothetical protein